MMDKRPLPPDVRSEAVARARRVTHGFQNDIGREPTLGEFLEILELSVPSNECARGLPVPLRLIPRMREDRRYNPPASSSVGELNDASFVHAGEFLAFVAERVHRLRDGDVSAGILASALVEILQAEDSLFGDVAGADLRGLEISGDQPGKRASAGDIVAIPIPGVGYRLAVVLTRNRFGLALGFVDGVTPFPRAPRRRRVAARHSIYTDDRLIATRLWPVVDHDSDLLTLFPREPEIYHAPDGLLQDSRVGDFGAGDG